MLPDILVISHCNENNRNVLLTLVKSLISKKVEPRIKIADFEDKPPHPSETIAVIRDFLLASKQEGNVALILMEANLGSPGGDAPAHNASIFREFAEAPFILFHNSEGEFFKNYLGSLHKDGIHNVQDVLVRIRGASTVAGPSEAGLPTHREQWKNALAKSINYKYYAPRHDPGQDQRREEQRQLWDAERARQEAAQQETVARNREAMRHQLAQMELERRQREQEREREQRDLREQQERRDRERELLKPKGR